MQILALNIILGAAFIAFVYGIIQKKNSTYFLLSSLFCIFVYSLFTLLPLQQLFFGNQGDELFILAQLTHYQDFQLFSDFYYQGLPPFYPPLYFWVTGLLSFWLPNAVMAMKLGLLAVIVPLWTAGTYSFQKYFWKGSYEKSFYATPWLWILVPIVFFVWVDYPEFLTKPYEALPALFNVLWLGLFSYAIETKKKLDTKSLLFFGITGGLSFLMYYFWWIILIPVLIVLTCAQAFNNNSWSSFLALMKIGLIMFVIASPYLIPLVISWIGGMENWQARHLVLSDFNIWLPFFQLSVHGLIAFVGVIGLYVHATNPFVKANWYLFLATYVYQFINFLTFHIFQATGQPSKPFLFLGGAALCVGFVFALKGIVDFVTRNKNFKSIYLTTAKVVLVIILFVPITLFTNNPDVRAELNASKSDPKGGYLAEVITEEVPDYRERTWLSSGIPEINAFIPLKYYIAHNAHFSHQASEFSRRLSAVKILLRSETAQEFNVQAESLGIDGLLLYEDKAGEIMLYFWVDNFPNGGITTSLPFNSKVIDSSWERVFNDDEWRIYIRNNDTL